MGILAQIRSSDSKKRIKMKLARWEEVEDFAEFLANEKGVEQAERDVVVEALVKQFLNSQKQMNRRFEQWKKSDEEEEGG